MALWEDFAKRAGDTARSFALRAREVAETTKLNGQIAVKKTEEERLYAQIGKAYCQARSQGSENGELEELCGRIDALHTEIAAIQAQIDKTRQVRRCKACGAVCPTSSRFCAACGARFEDEPEQPAQPETPAEPAPEEPAPEEEGVQINWPEAPTAEEPAEPDEPAEPEAPVEPTDAEDGK